MTIPTGVSRFDAKIEVRQAEYKTACWIWVGADDGQQGYGSVHHSGRTRKAHRVVYETLVGSVPHDLVLDHLCRTPACVNPGHLEPVTHAENIRRGSASVRGGKNPATECVNGHPYTPQNVYVRNGARKGCAQCRKDHSERHYREKRQGLPKEKCPYCEALFHTNSLKRHMQRKHA